MWSFMALNYVSAQGQYYTYPGDNTIQEQKNINTEQETWQYQHEIPSDFHAKYNLSQFRYRFAPPSQKVGSNPITNPQHKYQFSVNNYVNSYAVRNTGKNTYVTGNAYSYPTFSQRSGSQRSVSNPFADNTYVTEYVTENFYNYPPPSQKVGSNPFIKSNNKYLTPEERIRISAFSYDEESIEQQGAFVNY